MFGCRKKAILPIHHIPLCYYPFKGNLEVPLLYKSKYLRDYRNYLRNIKMQLIK